VNKTCDTCGSEMNLFATIVDGKYHPNNQHRCGFCLEDDDSAKNNGKWVKFNTYKNREEFKKCE
jgi:hypothetical protein